jgi:hypothetical protein
MNSFVIAIKLKDKDNFRTAAKMLFYVLQRSHLNKRGMFFEDLLPYTTSKPSNK